MNKIYVFSGLGVDKRVYDNIDFGTLDVEFIDWIEPLKNESLENYYTSMQDYHTSYNNEQNVETRSIIKEKLNATYSKFKETFSSLNYDERKTILVYDEIKASPSNTFIVLDKTNLPNKLKFPFSHPKKEEIYNLLYFYTLVMKILV